MSRGRLISLPTADRVGSQRHDGVTASRASRPATPRSSVSAPATKAPTLPSLSLEGLAPGDVDDLRPRTDLEGEQFLDLDLGLVALNGARLDATAIDGLRADDLDVKATRFTEVRLGQLDVPSVRAARTQWREVELSGRLGSIEAYEADWRSVHFIGCKIGYLNLRGAELTDVAFTDCQITDLDLVGTTARRVAFAGSRIDQLTLRDGRLNDVDLRGAQLAGIQGLASLRGATVSEEQLLLLAPLLAVELGLRVEG